ncbi:MAG: DNA cytosine methyltransferase [Phormidium sp. BM_Day4_Bin.17]|nr:DNA cytosine methyltransferase [Phormidium sp. BM_Day4_Bin.17]UCJ13948.1 MAG: DNA cytosine methyltransferase [Phormidium sp. PBR-2020]
MRINRELKKNNNSNSTDFHELTGVDLFCGAGGLTRGLEKTGITITFGIDIDPECEYPYQTNNEAIFINKDINKISSQELLHLFKKSELKLLAGCAPCQPFSTYSRKSQQQDDTKWVLVSEFSRLVHEVKPELVTMENVPQLMGHKVFKEFLNQLKSDNYYIWYDIVECSKYGVPQTRKRLVLVASLLNEIQLLSPEVLPVTKPATVREYIERLPSIAAGSSDVNDPLHKASSLSELNLRRIRASKPGGTWRDWPPELLAECHSKISGKTYPSVYGRMEWDAPAPTITTQCFGYGNGRFGHPEQDRAISLREAALLQTFPENYRFVSSDSKASFNTLGRLIGNAVPVRLGEVIGYTLQHHLAVYKKRTIVK